MVMMLLRISHIFFGVVLAGYMIFMSLMLVPQLKRLGPAIQIPVMLALGKVIPPVMGTSVLIVFGTGVAMTLNIRQGNLSTLLSSAWGWAIALGFVLTLAIIVVAFGLQTPRGIRMGKIGQSSAKRAPTPQEAQQLLKLETELETLDSVNFVLVIITLLGMLFARYL